MLFIGVLRCSYNFCLIVDLTSPDLDQKLVLGFVYRYQNSYLRKFYTKAYKNHVIFTIRYVMFSKPLVFIFCLCEYVLGKCILLKQKTKIKECQMRILGLFLSIMMLSVFANANICDPGWLAGDDGNGVRSFIRAGADPNQTCNAATRNRPLHQALLDDRVDPSVIEALIDAGADLYAENTYRETPIEYAQGRFSRLRIAFSESGNSVLLLREEALYNRIMNTSSDASSAVADAHGQLCDLNWWRRSASGPAVQQLLSIPGVDPDYVCNFNNDLIIHQPLKLASFSPMLPEGVFWGIKALVDAGASLSARNDTGDTAVSLAGIRYDRVTDRMIQHQIRWCRSEITGQQLESEVTQNMYDTGTYLYITSSATGQSYDQAKAAMMMELYRIEGTSGSMDYRVLCLVRGVNVR